jgi:Deoxyribonuclease NucA/NucB
MDRVVALHIVAQLPADLLPSLVLLIVLLLAMALAGRGLRSSPDGGVALLLPGSRRLRRMMLALLLLLITFAWLDSLDQPDRGRERRLPVFVVNSDRTPVIARHVRQALDAGYPSLLHRAPGNVARANRRAACGGWPRRTSQTDPECDEYPFASAFEGGRGASVAPVPPLEQRRQGGLLLAFFTKENVQVGDPFLVVVR